MLKRNLLIIIIISFYTINYAHATSRIDITRGVREPLPIAITDLHGISDEEKELGNQISSVIENDLESSGLFRSIDKLAFIEQSLHLNNIPSFASWRQINAASLVMGNIKISSDGLIKVEFKLWDTYSELQIAGKSYALNSALWRRVAHKIADEIYQRLTGDTSYFDTRIAYISETGPGLKRIKRLAIMDQDGENNEFLTKGNFLVLTPRFSPSGQQLLYLSYENKNPNVYLMDIKSKRSILLGKFPGMTLAPRFSPDGKKIVMSVSYNGNTDIYLLDLTTSQSIQLTDDRAIDISPSFSPDSNQIVFASDRGGRPQLYIMDSNGTNLQRISFGEGSYTTPIWSPRGDMIAFTKKQSGSFYIGVMNSDGSGERILAQGFLVEGPTWSPNGRTIMYTRGEPSHGGKIGTSRIFSIDLTGYNEREIITPTDASDPAWSPLLP
ncbi:translocation protein TolB [Rickettsiales bacterium Ac37b]|nr:translocation protein TolB [Rickettsiales bacterium Ac37b]